MGEDTNGLQHTNNEDHLLGDDFETVNGGVGGIMITDPALLTHSPLIVTPSSAAVINSQNPNNLVDYRAFEQIKSELREENDRIRSQEGRLKKFFDNYKYELAKLE